MTEEPHLGSRRSDRRRRPAQAVAPAGKHSAGWLITYSDMVTLLMAFFIGVIAVYARGTGGVKKPADLAAADKSRSSDADTEVWRLRTPSAPAGEGSPALLSRNPTPQTAAMLLRCLEAPSGEALASRHAVRLPLDLLFDAQMRLTPSGSRLLAAIAAGIRALPCDLHFHVEKSRHIPQAVDLCSYLMLREGLLPGRLAVGSHPPAEGAGAGIWLVLVPHF